MPHLLKARALGGQRPKTPGEIMRRFEQTERRPEYPPHAVCVGWQTREAKPSRQAATVRASWQLRLDTASHPLSVHGPGSLPTSQWQRAMHMTQSLFPLMVP